MNIHSPFKALSIVLIPACCLLFAAAAMGADQTADQLIQSAADKTAKGDREGAIADLTRAIALDPKSAIAYDMRGVARTGEGYWGYGPDGIWRLNAGPTHAKTSDADWVDSFADYDRAVALDPKYTAAWIHRAYARAALYDLMGAAADLDHAIALDPNNAHAWFSRGNIEEEKGPAKACNADLDHAIALDPKFAAAYFERGKVNFANGDRNNVIADLSSAIALDPNNAAMYIERAEAKSNAHDMDGALADLARAIELDPKSAPAYFERAALKGSDLKDAAGAIADYTRAIELDPGLAEAYKQRGDVKQYYNHDTKGAEADYALAGAIDPWLHHIPGKEGEPQNPSGAMVLSGQALYGTTTSDWDEKSGGGTVFKINTDGTGLEYLHRFSAANVDHPVNDGGAHPEAGLILAGEVLYGTASWGGSGSAGTVFKIKTNGQGFTVLHHFKRSEEGCPKSGLLLAGGTLYGVTGNYGNNSGVVFKINIDGSGFAVLHTFPVRGDAAVVKNNDGISPAGLALSGNTLYGTTADGGTSGSGTLFQVNTDGTGYLTLHTFDATTRNKDRLSVNHDGAFPGPSLLVSGDELYGTTTYAGSAGGGTVFKIKTDGGGCTALHAFTTASGEIYNPDGEAPGKLALSGDILYGATSQGGTGAGTIFQVNTDGTGFATLPVFTKNRVRSPGRVAFILQSGKALFGAMESGGKYGGGLIFKMNADAIGFTPLHNFIKNPYVFVPD